VNIFLFIQVPAIVGIGGFVAYDVYMASTGQQGKVDSAGHVGGALFGVLYWLLRVRGR
jgi:membrane associated rhomboid family serine protease